RLVAAQTDHPIDHEKGVAVRQCLHDRRNVGGLQRRRFLRHSPPLGRGSRRLPAVRPLSSEPDAIRSRSSISRNHSLTGFAGVPPHLAPAGTSSFTTLIAAIWLPSPSVT